LLILFSAGAVRGEDGGDASDVAQERGGCGNGAGVGCADLCELKKELTR
jgi:hypothetical protein